MGFILIKNIITSLISIFVVGVMVFASQHFKNPEIIFPEIAAIAVGSILSPRIKWNVNKWGMFWCIIVCAVGGVLIVKFLPFPIWMQMIMGYALAQVIFLLSKTTFAPMISAMVLPIMLQTSTPVYILSAICFTLLILIFRTILEKTNIVEISFYDRLSASNSQDFFYLVVRSLIIVPVIILCIKFDFRFAVAPPLIVAFTEFSMSNKSYNELSKVVVLITATSLLGAACRYILTINFGLPLFVSAIITMSFVCVLMLKTNMFIPPAGAVAILAMLISEKYILIYPLEIFIGTAILSILAKLCSDYIFPKINHRKNQ